MSTADKIKYVGKIVPPFSNNVYRLKPAKATTRIKKAVEMIVAGGFVCFLGWVASLFIVHWLLYVGFAIGVLTLVFALNAIRAGKIGNCPYCNGVVGEGDKDVSPNNENEMIECSTCHELIISHKGAIRAFSLADAEGKEELQVSVFKDGVWPNECLVCGAPVEHTEDAAKMGFNAAKLLVGTLSISRGSIKNIPYCKKHTKAVRLKSEDDKLLLIFTDLGALRRYISVNKGKQVL